MPLQELEEALEIKVVPIESGGKEFIEAILNPDYSMDRENDNFVYIQAFEKGKPDDGTEV